MLLRHTMLYLPAQLRRAGSRGVVAAIVWTHWLAPASLRSADASSIASQDLLSSSSAMSWWTQFTLRYLDGLDGGEHARTSLRSEASVACS